MFHHPITVPEIVNNLISTDYPIHTFISVTSCLVQKVHMYYYVHMYSMYVSTVPTSIIRMHIFLSGTYSSTVLLSVLGLYPTQIQSTIVFSTFPLPLPASPYRLPLFFSQQFTLVAIWVKVYLDDSSLPSAVERNPSQTSPEHSVTEVSKLW